MAFLKTLLIGARGVGKTSLLERWATATTKLDLDAEIVRDQGSSIEKIFENFGEDQFRETEFETLNRLLLNPEKMIISVGAGFRWLDYEFPIPRKKIEIIWVRRTTDDFGRIFFDRPRLNQEIPAIDEFLLRHKSRVPAYMMNCDRVYKMPEGLQKPDEIEKSILENELPKDSGILTRTPKNKSWNWGGRIELRNDFWSAEEVFSLNYEDVLWTHRETGKESELLVKEKDWLDWPLEFGLPTLKSEQLILSLHDLNYQETLEQAHRRLESEKAWHYKSSPLISTWEQLETGWKWQQADIKNRSFLPRSPEGRWNWYRQWSKGHQKINFVQDGINPVKDQPSFYEWLSIPESFSHFAAVLGDPVQHSYSPIEQGEFFKDYGWPFFAIPISKSEWSVAISLLTKMGLRAAAVTAPLKLEMDPARPVNTLVWSDELTWEGMNTDIQGLKLLLDNNIQEPVVLWGGGGILASVREVVPTAAPYSSRTGLPKTSVQCLSPKTLIWAAGPNDPSPAMHSFKGWQPQLVIDLNYREDSEARSYALQTGARYKNGLALFQSQAQGQREFWKTRIQK